MLPSPVVEAWVFSEPRLVGAVSVSHDLAEGDSVLLAVSFGAPLDGGGAIEEGAHMLQLRVYSTTGPEVLATGLTVGGATPDWSACG